MKNADTPANPIMWEDGTFYIKKGDECIPTVGMTKREEIASRIMSGLATNSDYNKPCDMARDAVRHADALLAELEKDND